MLKIGKMQTLKVDHEDQSGFYLLCDENYEVFMPGTLAPKGLKKGASVDVFVFVDSKGDVIATGTPPLAQVDEFACLKVKEISKAGVFLDMGLPKDLLIPKKLRKYEMRVGDVHLVMILKDKETDQLYATEKIGPFLNSTDVDLRSGQSVSLVPFHRTPLGFKVLVDKKYHGMVYHNEIFSEVVLGQSYEGTVKHVRPDGQVDSLLRKSGLEGAAGTSENILNALKKAGGKLALWDKSSPEEIKTALGINKKSFKSAVGILYKKRLITINDGCIELADSNEAQ